MLLLVTNKLRRLWRGWGGEGVFNSFSTFLPPCLSWFSNFLQSSWLWLGPSTFGAEEERNAKGRASVILCQFLPAVVDVHSYPSLGGTTTADSFPWTACVVLQSSLRTADSTLRNNSNQFSPSRHVWSFCSCAARSPATFQSPLEQPFNASFLGGSQLIHKKTLMHTCPHHWHPTHLFSSLLCPAREGSEPGALTFYMASPILHAPNPRLYYPPTTVLQEAR